MIETGINSFLTENLDPAIEISWGKEDATVRWDDGTTTISFFKLPSQSARVTPSYLDSFQISVRSRYIDAAQSVANQIITLFHLYHGKLGDYLVNVDDIFTNGVLYEAEDIVHVPLTLRVKYTQL